MLRFLEGGGLAARDFGDGRETNEPPRAQAGECTVIVAAIVAAAMTQKNSERIPPIRGPAIAPRHDLHLRLLAPPQGHGRAP